jgi:hypothetical protein
MLRCEQYQAQLLSYLYDLLEKDEQHALREHMSHCGSCQTALARAEQQKKLLASAAKAAFPAVRFQPPASEGMPEERTPVYRLVFPRRVWLGWSIAASILLLLGLGVPATVWGWRYVAAQQEAQALAAEYQAKNTQMMRLSSEYHASLAQKRQAVLDVHERMNKLVQDAQQKWAALQQAARERQLNVLVSGPQTIQPGAANTYQITTQDRNNQLVRSQLDVRVLDVNQRVLFEANNINSTGEQRVSLPANLPVEANNSVHMEVVARQAGGQQEEIREELALATPVYVTHLTTDKPMYRPGETVYFRSLTLERFSLKPAQEDFQLVYTLTKPTGEEVPMLSGSPLLFGEDGRSPLLGPDKKPIRGIGAGEFTLDAAAPGGEYTLTVREAANRFAPQLRKFIVNRYENPRLNKELDFTRKSYGPGDEVVAACKVSRVEGGAGVAHQPVTATIRIDGKFYGSNGKEDARPLSLHTDERGAVNIRFWLPRVIDRGQASLSVQFQDGASIETLVRPIPITVKKLRIEFFPEGGDLVPGVSNRVYFQAWTMLDKPAEVKGRIVDSAGAVVAQAETLHDDQEPGINQGMGAFTFTPQAGGKYELKIDTPVGIEGTYGLPVTKEDGVALRIPTGVTKAKEPIRIVVNSGDKDRTLLVGAYCRGRLMDHQTVIARKGEATTVTLQPAQEMGGVYRVTVFEERAHQQLVPVAERLVYRRPAEQLLLQVKPDKKPYVPGDKVKLSLTALNEKEQPAPAILLVGVVDKSVVTMADEKTFRSMPTHYLLTTEVRKPEDLEYADVLLGPHPKAAAALDLLLGTQGWRRFAEQNPAKFRQQFREDADHLLMTMGQSPLKSVELTRQEEHWQTEFETQLTKLEEQETKAGETLVAAQNDKELPARIEAMQNELAQLHQRQSAAAQQAEEQRVWINKASELLLPAVAVLLTALVVVLLVLAIRRSRPRAILSFVLSDYVLAGVCSLLAVAMVVWLLSPVKQVAREDNPTALARTAQPSVFQDNILVAGGGGAKAEARDAQMEQLLRLDADKAKEIRAQLWDLDRGNALQLQRGKGEGKGGAEPPAPAAALAKVEAKAHKPMAFGLQPMDDRAAMNRKKDALPQPALKRDLAAGMPAKDGERQLTPLPLGQKLQEVEALREAGQKQVPAVRLLQANRRQPMQAAGVAGLNARFRNNGAVPGLQPPMALGRGFGGLQIDAAGKRVWRNAPAPQLPPPPQPLIVRQYAHFRPTSSPSEVRSDFVDTVYWHPVLVLPDGKADIAFDLCDAVTSYQVTVVGHTLDGRIGAVTSTLESRLPFVLEPKLPIEVTSSDKIDMPVSIANNTSEPRSVQIHVASTGLRLLPGPKNEPLTIPADQRVRRLFRLQPAIVEGPARVQLSGESLPFTDSVTRTLQVVPEGFPVVGSRSDMLERIAQQDIVLPESWVPGTLKCQVQVYPSTLADLQKGLESLLREPGGCFEQTSSSNYPNLLILDYLKESNQAKPEAERRARDLLARGYQKLTAFECLDTSKNRRQGYEWFGGTAPAHEALTAYGLLEFRDMARVFDVDQNMLERTRHYLMSRKDGKGGFQRNPRALDSFGRAPEDITNAYIVWALTESGKDDDVEKELAALSAQAKTSTDPYFLALVATSLLNRSKTEDGVGLLKTVAGAQKEDGHVDAGRTSITGSGGRTLQIETTALAVLGWLKANRPADFNVNVQKAIQWLGRQRGGYGGFGSTQSTILALKALIAFTKANKKTAESGDLRLCVGAEEVAHLNFAAGVQDALVLNVPEPDKHLKAGQNSVRVEMTGKNTFPYTLTWSYQTLKPASAENCPLRLTTHLDRTAAAEGETVHLTVTVENAIDKGQGMAVAIIGLPGGLTLPEDMKQLKEYARLRNNGTEKGLIAAWETRGRELVLYWRDLAPKQHIEVPIDLICRVPGEYSGPASRAYLYYNADRKHWVEPLKVKIEGKAE